MKKFLRNRNANVAFVVGPLVGLATGLVFALGVILTEGGGSFPRGWGPGSSYLSFYGLFLLPVLAVLALVAMGLSRLLGAGIVTGLSAIGLAALVINDLRSSSPGAQLARITGRSAVPDLEFERFEIGHTFSDGSSYLWVAICSPEEATGLAKAIGLERIQTWREMDARFPIRIEHRAVGDYQDIFKGDIDTVEFYADGKGMIGGYAPSERKFRLYWWPALQRE